MNDKIQVLDRYFHSFIDIEDDYEFFFGLKDYLHYLDSVPEIEQVAAELPKLRIEEENKLAVLEKAAIDELLKFRDKLHEIVQKNKIKHDEIDAAFKEFDDYTEGRTISTTPLVIVLNSILESIISKIKDTEYRNQVERYFKPVRNSPNHIERFTFSKKYEEYSIAKEILKAKMQTELFGEFDKLAQAYVIMTTGKDQFNRLRTEAGNDVNKQPGKWLEVMGFSTLLAEWNQILDHKRPNYPAVFDIKVIRFSARRIHNYLIEAVLVKKTASDTPQPVFGIQNASSNTNFRPTLGIMPYRNGRSGYIQLFPKTKKIPIGGLGTRQCRLIQVLFNPINGQQDVVYHPTFQVVDRVYDSISLSKDAQNGNLKINPVPEKRKIIEHTIKEIQKIKELQGYIEFEWDDMKRRVQMVMHPKQK